ncbi:hypothetical protein Salat_1449000 [Sesamum alatum]|uniref:Uncharacterized protein n=1 Tax=Sesamum alatum TaxID=300844 RepID=A0AAE1YAV0_9LAMI|nr:hypothetical protein Salat_1449000 [Sesamum alatum]
MIHNDLQKNLSKAESCWALSPPIKENQGAETFTGGDTNIGKISKDEQELPQVEVVADTEDSLSEGEYLETYNDIPTTKNPEDFNYEDPIIADLLDKDWDAEKARDSCRRTSLFENSKVVNQAEVKNSKSKVSPKGKHQESRT